MNDVLIEFELGNKALLVPQPDHKPIVWLSSLYAKRLLVTIKSVTEVRQYLTTDTTIDV